MPPQSSKAPKDKILGWLLLAVGLFTIGFSTVLIIRIFFGKAQPPAVFNVEAPSLSLLGPSGAINIPEGIDLPQGINLEEMQSQQKPVKLIPDEVFNKLLNMSVFYLAMMFLASSGSKFASIGIQLLKDPKPKT